MIDLHASILPRIEAEGGRVVDTAGDSILAEFGSVLAAVRMAVTVQAQMKEGGTSERPLKVRFGITQGEIVFDGLRVYGDGVNVAARLQALAAPGGVAISGRVHEDIVGKIGLDWTDLGEPVAEWLSVEPTFEFDDAGRDIKRSHVRLSAKSPPAPRPSARSSARPSATDRAASPAPDRPAAWP